MVDGDRDCMGRILFRETLIGHLRGLGRTLRKSMCQQDELGMGNEATRELSDIN